MVKVLTMGKNLHYYGQDDVARDKVLKQVTVFVTAKQLLSYTGHFDIFFSSHRVFILCIMTYQIYHVSINVSIKHMLNYNIWITKMGNIKQHDTQTDDPITNDRCIHRACSYSRAHLPGNGNGQVHPFQLYGI